MKTALPQGHGLSARLLKTELIRTVNDTPSLTDAQYSSLKAGAAKKRSLLVIAPTSSGKTDIGLYDAASWLEHRNQMSHRIAYLVSHRALARQKYLEFRRSQMLKILQLELPQLILATGDDVIDGNGDPRQDPLDGAFVIATYEKFLAMLAGSGLRQDMSHYCIIAYEIQLLSDKHRGQDIEILLTLIRAAGFGQFIGLSAVLDESDSKYVAGWLDLNLVRVISREVPLVLELRTRKATHVTTVG